MTREQENADAYRLRGGVYRDMSEYQKAIGDISEAIRLDPDSAYAYGLRGYIYTT